MPIPSYQNMLLPLLQFLKDGEPHSLASIEKHLANNFHLTKEEKTQLKPSGHERLLHNRVHWAKYYLKKAGLVDSPQKSDVKITMRGLDVLKEKLDKIDIRYLNKFRDPFEDLDIR